MLSRRVRSASRHSGWKLAIVKDTTNFTTGAPKTGSKGQEENDEQHGLFVVPSGIEWQYNGGRDWPHGGKRSAGVALAAGPRCNQEAALRRFTGAPTLSELGGAVRCGCGARTEWRGGFVPWKAAVSTCSARDGMAHVAQRAGCWHGSSKRGRTTRRLSDLLHIMQQP